MIIDQEEKIMKNKLIVLMVLLLVTLLLCSCEKASDEENSFVPTDTGREESGEASEDTAESETSGNCEHSFGEWSIVKAATCKESGESVRVCTLCSEREEKAIEKTDDHTPVIDAAVPATCKDTGLSEGSHCSLCDKVLVEQVVVPTTDDHTLVIDAAVPATCKDTGLSEGSHCSLCGKVLVEQVVVPTTDNHTPIIDAAVPATCKDTGLSEGSHCSLCGKVLVEQVVVPTTDDHDIAAADCMLLVSYCKNCDYKVESSSKHVIVDGVCTGCGAKTVSTVEELKNITLGGKYILVNDLSLKNLDWTPIGTDKKPFSGYFDGNGYTISDLTIKPQYNYFGLFGYSSGVIQNLGVKTASISGLVTLNGAIYVGGLVGYSSGSVTNCYASEVNIDLRHSNAGIASGFAGGLAGYSSGKVLSSYSSGSKVSMSAMSTYAWGYAHSGGLVGYNQGGSIENCYSSVKKVSGSYNSSQMGSESNVGGFIGKNNGGVIANCYRDSAQKFYSTVDSTSGYKPTNNEGISVEAAEIKTVAFHTDKLGWSADLWLFSEGSLPSLKKDARVST